MPISYSVALNISILNNTYNDYYTKLQIDLPIISKYYIVVKLVKVEITNTNKKVNAKYKSF